MKERIEKFRGATARWFFENFYQIVTWVGMGACGIMAYAWINCFGLSVGSALGLLICLVVQAFGNLSSYDQHCSKKDAEKGNAILDHAGKCAKEVMENGAAHARAIVEQAYAAADQALRQAHAAASEPPSQDHLEAIMEFAGSTPTAVPLADVHGRRVFTTFSQQDCLAILAQATLLRHEIDLRATEGVLCVVITTRTQPPQYRVEVVIPDDQSPQEAKTQQ